MTSGKTPTPKNLSYSDEEVPLDSLKEYPGNPRIHREDQINELKRSLEMFGQFRPLVLDDQNVILAGNGMFMAMKELGWKFGKATRISGASEAVKKKLLLADNRIATMGYTDYVELDRVIAEINEVQIPGFDEDYISQMLASAEEALELAESYGTFDTEDIEKMKSLEGTYSGENVPQNLLPPQAAPSEPPAVVGQLEPTPQQRTVLDELRELVEAAESSGGAEVRVPLDMARGILGWVEEN